MNYRAYTRCGPDICTYREIIRPINVESGAGISYRTGEIDGFSLGRAETTQCRESCDCLCHRRLVDPAADRSAPAAPDIARVGVRVTACTTFPLVP